MKWSNKEIEILKLYYEREPTWINIKSKLSNRSSRAIKAKAKALGLSREQFSTENYGYAYCIVHGRIYGEIIWIESKSGKSKRPRCPVVGCNRQVRLIRANRLSIREKNRRE